MARRKKRRSSAQLGSAAQNAPLPPPRPISEPAHAPGWRRRLIWIGAILTLAVLMFGAWSAWSAWRRTQRRPPNLLLVTLDTTRADALSLYSTAGTPVPELEALARRGILFRKAYSQVPLTLPAHSTMMTGVYPHAHGVLSNTVAHLPRDLPTVAALLKRRGYATAGFIASIVLASSTGVARGFDTFEETFTRSDIRSAGLGGIQRRAEQVIDAFLEWQGGQPSDRPFFAWIHLYDPHTPYDPPADFRPPGEAPEARELYRAEIRYADSQIGRLAREVERRGLSDDTFWLVVGDHGEMLGEMGEREHGYLVFRPAIEVPFLIVPPGRRPARVVDAVVGLIDIAPTLLAQAGVRVPAAMVGTDLQPLIDAPQPAPARWLLSASFESYLAYGFAPMLSLVDGQQQFLCTPESRLFPLDSESAANGAAPVDPATQERLQRIVQRLLATARAPEARPAGADPERLKALAALGYAAASSSRAPSSWQLNELLALPDPVAQLPIHQTYEQALDAFMHKDYGAAHRLVGELSGSHPDLPAPLLLLAQIELELGRAAVAGAHLDRYLKMVPDNHEAIALRARAAVFAGDLNLATKIYRAVLADRSSDILLIEALKSYEWIGAFAAGLQLLEELRPPPRGPELEIKRAELTMYLGQDAAAAQIVEPLIEQKPGLRSGLKLLALLRQRQRDFAGAIRWLDIALQHHPSDADLMVDRGSLTELQGDLEAARGWYLRALEADPRSGRAHLYYAKFALQHRGDLELAIEHARRGLKLNPDRIYLPLGHGLLAEALSRQGDLEQAREHARQALELQKGL